MTVAGRGLWCKHIRLTDSAALPGRTASSKLLVLGDFLVSYFTAPTIPYRLKCTCKLFFVWTSTGTQVVNPQLSTACCCCCCCPFIASLLNSDVTFWTDQFYYTALNKNKRIRVTLGNHSLYFSITYSRLTKLMSLVQQPHQSQEYSPKQGKWSQSGDFKKN